MISATAGSLLKTYVDSDALGLAGLVRRGEVSPMELVEAAITVLEHINPRLNAVIHRLYESARSTAAMVDRQAAFAGVPFLLSDYATAWEGAPLTNASRYCQGATAASDSEAARRMKAAGLVPIGKSNAPEFGLAMTTEPKLHGPTRNPWRPDLAVCGSSGGTAAAVAARLVPIGDADDGIASVRIAASSCGVVGLKPSRGRVVSSSLAGAGRGASALCCSRSVRDAAAYLDIMAGGASSDLYAPRPSESWLDLSARPHRRRRVGFTVRAPRGLSIDPQVKASVLKVASRLEGLGHDVEEHDLSSADVALWQAYARLVAAQFALELDWHAKTVGRPAKREDVEPATWSMLEHGREAADRPGDDFSALRRFGHGLAEELASYDIFITPTLPQLPRALDSHEGGEPDLDAHFAWWKDAAFTFPFTVAGLPAISLPLGWAVGAIPIGVQLVGRLGDEADLLAISMQLEQAMPWKRRRPPTIA